MQIVKRVWQRWLDQPLGPARDDPQPPDGPSADGLRFRPLPDVVERHLGNELFLVNLARGSVYRLNRTGVAVWELAGQCLTAAEIAARMQASWAVPPEQLRHDVCALLTDLLAQHLLESVPVEVP